MKSIKYLSFFLFACFISSNVHAQKRTKVVGQWVTIDDVSGKKKSVVEIFKKEDKYFGKVIKLFDESKQNSVCTACDEDDPRYNKKIIGMEILKDLKKDDNVYEGGSILDPKNGKVYSCKMWIEDGNLIVRGFIGFSFIGRSQTWLPY